MQRRKQLIGAVALIGLASALALPATAQIGDVFKDISKEAKQKGDKKNADGDFKTFGASAWSAKCSKDDPLGCERDAEFAGWFPSGLAIGDQDGIDGDKKYAIVMRTSQEAVSVLKNDGPATTLDTDSLAAQPDVNPDDRFGLGQAKVELGGGNLARHLTAAKLNLAYNRGRAGRGEPGFGQNIVVSGVAKPLIGYSVRDIVDLADRALSGAFGEVGRKNNDKPLFDSDRDSKADVSLNDVTDALLTINLSFRKGSKLAGSVQARMPVADAGATDAGKPGVVTPKRDDPERTGDPVPVAKPEKTTPASAPTQPAVEPTEGARTLITFTQADWSKDQADKLQNYILQQNFEKLFPRGMLIGDPQGIDQDDRYCLIFKTAKDLGDFLPAKGKPGSLSKNALNPNDSEAGSLAGELIAAKLNVLFDDRGFMPQGGGGKLGKQVFLSEVAKPLRGVMVLQVLRIAERTLAGDFGSLHEPGGHAAKAIDVDGDGEGDISAVELTHALERLNKSFQGGKPHGSPFEPDGKDKHDGKHDEKGEGNPQGKAKGKGKGKGKKSDK